MREDLRDGTEVAVRLAGGAPLRDALVVADAGDWLVLDAAVREVAWYRGRGSCRSGSTPPRCPPI